MHVFIQNMIRCGKIKNVNKDFEREWQKAMIGRFGQVKVNAKNSN